MINPNELIEICKNKTVWIQTHNFPDPDAISSAFGLQQLLAHFDITSRLCHEGQIDKLSSLKMLDLCGITMVPYGEVSDVMQSTDRIILVDCQKNNGNTTDLIGKEMAAIDHHPTFVKVDYEYADLRITGACASLIADYYRALGIEPDAKTATALIYGLRMDTLQLSRGVTEFDVEMYEYLFRYADKALLHELETNNMEFADLQAYGSAIEHIRCFGKGIYAKRHGGYKFSIRSEHNDVHAGNLANIALKEWGNGGGHASMAGGFAEEDKLPKESGYLFDAVQEHFMYVIGKEWPQIL